MRKKTSATSGVAILGREDIRNARLAEYKALRDESLRCSQLLANAVWVAVTAYALTIGSIAAYIGKTGVNGLAVEERTLVPAAASLLCVEALTITVMYLS